MPRLSVETNPKLRRHAASGQGVSALSGRDYYLGRWPVGQKRPPTNVQAAYDRRIAEWRANGRRPLTATTAAAGLTVGELIARFWDHVEQHYRRTDGTPTGEVDNYRYARRRLRKLFEDLPAAEFSPLKLKAVRRSMVDADLARTLINQRVQKIVRMFRWAVSEELVPPDVAHGLREVAALQAGRCAARESKPVEPVADTVVDAALPFLLPPVAAMIRLMRLTGMRVGEACMMTRGNLDVTGDVWLYRPALHKTAHRGKSRVIALGPQSQQVLRPFLTAHLSAPLFSPARAVAEWAAGKRQQRATPLFASHVARYQRQRREKPKRRPREMYTPHAVSVAVRRASDRADRLARQTLENAKAEAERRAALLVPVKVENRDRTLPRWHPHQLRHRHADVVARQFGLDAARAVLGHSGCSITELYLAKDVTLATKIAAEVG